MPDLSAENQRLIEMVEEVLECPNLDAPMHTAVNCRYCVRTAPALSALDAIAAKLARLEKLERGAADFLDVAERVRGGDPSLSPEAWYAERDYMRVLLAAREEEPAMTRKQPPPDDPIVEIDPPPGYRWRWVELPSRRILADGDNTKCRRTGCKRPAVWKLRRSNGWWSYCDWHTYGSRIEDGKVLSRRAEEETA